MTYDYIVIILNYNSFEYMENAIATVRKCAIDTYKICVVDNNSPREGEKANLLSLSSDDVEVLFLDENAGYGTGNNKAFWYMKNKYESKYTVIMNPDIELIGKGIIESLIKNAESNGAVGGQPLVWNYHYGDDPKTQINIGKVADYFSLCIQSSLFLRIFFKKKFRELMFLNDMPYKKHIEYHMPSGAFFILRTDVFSEINGFDDDTFLYGEETIIAYKLFEKGYHLLLSPEYVVKHLQGATTGYDRYSWDKRRLEYMKQSRAVYLNKYLKVGRFKVGLLNFLLYIDYLARKAYVAIKKK